MPWIFFNLFVIAMLVIDLGVFHKKSHEVKMKEALIWSAVWITLALLFSAGVYYWEGKQPALEFLTGYLIEKSLSVDNIFVFVLVFQYFRVPRYLHHRVLFWGILGALVMRAIFIATGVTLIHKFHWIIYIFGIFLIVSGVKLAFEKDKEIEPEKNPMLKLLKRVIPVTHEYHDGKFFVRQAAKMVATPLFVTLVIVETTDLIFAMDSIPAILAISHDPFIVYTSNIFAILGLRSLYFALASIIPMFHHLHYGLSAILVFVGIKMLVGEYYKIPTGAALGIVGLLLAVSIIASLIWPAEKEDKH